MAGRYPGNPVVIVFVNLLGGWVGGLGHPWKLRLVYDFV